MNTLEKIPVKNSIAANEIAKVSIRLSRPVFYDSYNDNKLTGCGILIDEVTNETVASLMIE